MNIFLGKYIIKFYNYFFNRTQTNQTNQTNQTSNTNKCNVWYLDSKNFQYPELNYKQFNNKKDIGIALPSGGLRACVYSLGVLRGLHHLGILQETKYITSVSGSSWLTSIFSYQNITSNDIFLGKYIEPENITLEKLSNIQHPDEFTSVLYGALPWLNYLKYLVIHLVYRPINKNMDDLWIQVLGGIMYNKYKLNDFRLTPNISNTCNLNTIKIRDDVPLPIIIGYVDNIISNTFIEFTPLYYGMPIKNNAINGTGIYIEPIGMLSITQNILDNKQSSFNILTNNNVISIMKSAGISSNIIPIQLSNIGLSLADINYIGFNSINYLNEQLHMIDGGMIDEHTGLPSLIKRRVQNIICVCPIVTNEYVLNTNEQMIRANTKLHTYFDQESPNFIFDESQYKILLDKMIELGNNNKPIVVQMQMNIVFNNIYGIVYDDDYKPTVTFIHPSKNEWLDKLHITSKNYINNNQQNNCITRLLLLFSLISANFKNFPHTSFYHQKYSLELVNAMSQNASYDVISSFDKLKFDI
jgi:hypothetical protein